jgi:hypothetical protein
VAAVDDLVTVFSADPEAAVLDILRRAGDALPAPGIKQALVAGGVARAEVDRAWPRIQRRLRSHDRVAVTEDRRYVYTTAGPSAPDALGLLAAGGLSADRRAALAAIVRESMSSKSDQAAISFVGALAELAIEVEELAVNQASAKALVHRVRACARRHGLEPIEQAGEQSTLDRTRHEPVGRAIDDGTPVVVVRPGYVWKSSGGDVLIARAVVQDRS